MVRVQGADGNPQTAGAAWNGDWFDMDGGEALQVHSPPGNDPQVHQAFRFWLARAYVATNVRIKMERVQPWHRATGAFAMGLRTGIVFQNDQKETCRDVCGKYLNCKGFALRV